MDSSSRSLRITLLAIGVANIALAALFMFDPATMSGLYGDVLIDNMHLYLSSGLGVLLIVMAVGAFLAFAHPIKYAGIVLLIILSQFLLFISDVVVLARSQMSVMTLLPEMLYFLITAVLLVRYYPIEEKKKKESKEAVETVSAEPVLDETSEEKAS